MEVPTGVVADKYGRKVSMALGYLMSIIGIGLFVLYPTALIMYFMRFLQSTGSALVSGANEALLYESSMEAKLNYKKQSSEANANSIIGLCIAGVFASVIYQEFGDKSLTYLMLATIGTQLIAIILSLKIKEAKNHKESIVQKEAKMFSMLADTIHLLRTNK